MRELQLEKTWQTWPDEGSNGGVNRTTYLTLTPSDKVGHGPPGGAVLKLAEVRRSSRDGSSRSPVRVFYNLTAVDCEALVQALTTPE